MVLKDINNTVSYQIEEKENFCHDARFTVPKNKKAYILDIGLCSKTTEIMELKFRNFNEIFKTLIYISNNTFKDIKIPLVLEEKTDLYFFIKDILNNTLVFVNYDLILEEQN